MEYAFFLIVLILCIANFQFNHGQFVKPSMLYISTLAMAVGVYLTAFGKWEVNLSGVACAIMIIGFSMFWLGESLSCFLYQYFHKNSTGMERNQVILKMPLIVNIIVLCMCVITIYLSFNKMMDFISLANINSDSDTALAGVRYAKLMGEKTGIILALLTIILSAVGFIYQVLFFNDLIIGHKIMPLYFIFSICGILPGLFFASRYPLINYFIQCIAIIAVMQQWKYDWHYTIRFRDIVLILFAIALCLSVFLLMGTFTGKVDANTAISALQVYIASPVQGVDIVIANENYYMEEYPGEVIFARFYDLLFRLGIIDNLAAYAYPFLSAGRLVTNIYSANGDWFILAGLPGVIVGQFFVGAVLGWIYSYLKHCSNINLVFVFYFYIAQAYFGRIWAEKIFNVVFDFMFIIVLICWVIIWKFVNKEKCTS